MIRLFCPNEKVEDTNLHNEVWKLSIPITKYVIFYIDLVIKIRLRLNFLLIGIKLNLKSLFININ